jgi:hypothetical protein
MKITIENKASKIEISNIDDMEDIRLWKRIEYDYTILVSKEKLEEVYKNLKNYEY